MGVQIPPPVPGARPVASLAPLIATCDRGIILGSKWRNPDNEEILRQAVAEATSIAGVCRKLGIAPRGGNITTIRHHISRLDLDVSHHKGQGWKKDQYTDISKLKGASSIRKRLLRERGHRCERCQLSEWMGEPIPIEMDHINGNNQDHREENLRLLCSNCHALTPTFRNKRGWKKSGMWKATSVKVESTPKVPVEPNFCACGKQIKQRSASCNRCTRLAQSSINWPPLEEVIEKVRLTNFSKAGRLLGVSDNAIRKFLIRNGVDPKSLT